eukprot:m.44843 g.44843  ORF g.44843 m.44843 type:complete len:447 (-) comp10152_c0_seq2:517-1857(-)
MYINALLFVLLLLPFTATQQSVNNIVFVLVDDLGFDDTDVHGNAQIPTPNIRGLANEGVLLMNYYVMPVCTPTRAALMTGRHPIHTGMACGALLGQQRLGLPLQFETFPKRLQSAGWRTYMVGKWHLGFFNKSFIPTNRGFDEFYGFYTGKEDYFTKVDNEYSCGPQKSCNSPPFRCDNATFPPEPEDFAGVDLHGANTSEVVEVYNTELFTAKAIEMLTTHRAKYENQPSFLYLPYNAVHNANWADPLQAPERYRAPFRQSIRCDGMTGNNKTSCTDRQILAAMVVAVDEGIGNVTAALHSLGLWENTIMVISTDNGGPSDDQQGDSWLPKQVTRNVASNWPLRGKKATVWEGGVRAFGLVASPLLQVSRYANWELIHVTDWAPTLLIAAGIEDSFPSDHLIGDGVNAWETISQNKSSQRTEVLLNISMFMIKNKYIIGLIFDTK